MNRDATVVLVFFAFIGCFFAGITLNHSVGSVDMEQFHRAEALCAGVGSKVKSFDYDNNFKCENDK